MNHTVIGHLGEVGSTVYAFLKENDTAVHGHDTKGFKSTITSNAEFSEFLHICIPYTYQFIDMVKKYMVYTKPKYVIIYSTVPVGTCESIGDNVVHSPIEGKHPNLKQAFRTFKRFISGKKAEEVAGFFRNRELDVRVFEDAKITELAKLLSTTRYGLNLMFADEENRLCEKYNLAFAEVVLAYQDMYNTGYKSLGSDQFLQQKLIPPMGEIGGHCIVPNAKILSEICKDESVRRLSEYGKK